MYIKLVEILEEGGGYFCVQKMEIPGRRGGENLREIPSLVGVWIDILELHNLQNRTKV